MWHAIGTLTDVGFLWFEIGCCIYPYLYPLGYLMNSAFGTSRCGRLLWWAFCRLVRRSFGHEAIGGLDESEEEGKEELDECEGMSSRFGVWCMVYHRVGTVSFENIIKYSMFTAA